MSDAEIHFISLHAQRHLTSVGIKLESKPYTTKASNGPETNNTQLTVQLSVLNNEESLPPTDLDSGIISRLCVCLLSKYN